MSRSAHPAGPSHGRQLAGIEAPPRPAEPNTLNPAIWPATAQRLSSGELALGGLSATELAAEYGTPAYLLDTEDLRARARGYAKAFAGGDVFYAGKAFLSTAVAAMIADEGLGIDVCTAGELAIALRAGVDPERIALHGNNKSLDELALAIRAGVGRIVLDSHQEIQRLAWLADDVGVRVPVLVRVTVGVEAHTHEFIATAHEDQKFGFSLSTGQALTAVASVLEQPSLRLRGLH
ncbi:MAG TPA: diaminopimelate decarboxylase, partial [Jatrophihabitans sp.]|nr:diaminopimelate decarboxylase [Jatrophihabitans sp.]